MKIKKLHYYRAYGMNINSEIELPELLVNNYKECEHIDIMISYGSMPKEISCQIADGEYYNFEKDKMWFMVRNISRYYIHSGNTIIVEPYNNSNSHDVKTFLLGSAFGMLLFQRNIVAIHGGTVVVNGQALIITGNQGAGKSTLTSGFRNKGYSFMADDVSVTCIGKNGIPMVYPGYPQQKLCGDALREMRYNTDCFKRIDEGRDKYVIPVYSSFIKEPIPLGGIYEITVADCSKVEIEEITGIDKLRLFMKNIYRVEVLQYTGMNAQYFKECVNIAKMIPVFRIKRPKGRFTVDDQISVIEKTLRHQNNGNKLVI